MTADRGDSVRLDRLARLDAQLSWAGPVLSLGPGRPRARTLVALVGAIVDRDARCPSPSYTDQGLASALIDGLADIVEAMRAAFPDNLFWDLDFLAASLVRHADGAAKPLDALRRLAGGIVELQQQFGHETAIAFRYVHDFLYGFDWAKWVAKAPEQRAGVGPFDPDFVAYMRRRGEEIVGLVEQGNNGKYPPLSSGEHRNPFGFSRQPRSELVLHRRLARLRLLPVESWRLDAAPTWDRDFAALRREEALKLGLCRDVD